MDDVNASLGGLEAYVDSYWMELTVGGWWWGKLEVSWRRSGRRKKAMNSSSVKVTSGPTRKGTGLLHEGRVAGLRLLN